MSKVDVRLVTTFAELASLEEEWDALSTPFGMPLLDHDWILSAAEALHAEEDLRVVTVRERGQLTAVAPMALSREDRHLVVLGSTALYEPGSWLFASEHALGQLTKAVIDLGEVTVLDRVPATSAICRLLPGLAKPHAVTIARETAGSFGVRTDRPWAVLEAMLSTGTRRKLKAAAAKARYMAGDVRTEFLTPDSSTVGELFDQFVALEAEGWKGREGSALANRPLLARFFESYARRAAERRRLRVATLRLDGAVAAMELGVDAHGRHWGLKVTYDERIAPCAPALQLVHACINRASERGMTTYEFLGSAESWQQRWKPDRRDYQLTALYPLSGRAVLTALRDLTSHVSRRLVRLTRLDALPA